MSSLDELKDKNWFKLPTVGKEFAAKPFVDFRETQNKINYKQYQEK